VSSPTRDVEQAPAVTPAQSGPAAGPAAAAPIALGSGMTTASVIALQGSAGNQAVSRLLDGDEGRTQPDAGALGALAGGAMGALGPGR
jgi:hypothetical protein